MSDGLETKILIADSDNDRYDVGVYNFRDQRNNWFSLHHHDKTIWLGLDEYLQARVPTDILERNYVIEYLKTELKDELKFKGL